MVRKKITLIFALEPYSRQAKSHSSWPSCDRIPRTPLFPGMEGFSGLRVPDDLPIP